MIERVFSRPRDEQAQIYASRKRRSAFRRLLRNPSHVAGLLLAVGMALAALAASALAPYPPDEMHIDDALKGPDRIYLFGTDQFGRDVLSRVLIGARVSLLVGILATTLGMAIGGVLGLVSGYYGGSLDEALMRIMDVLLAFPFVVLAVALAAIVGPSLGNVIGIIAIVRLPQFARLARGQVLIVKRAEYVEAARALGAPVQRILSRHILPNIMTPIVVLGSLSLATAISTEAALSFLGVGIQPPAPSWGGLISEGRRFLLDAPWITLFPGVFISVTVLAYNLLGDGLRDVLDPRMAQ